MYIARQETRLQEEREKNKGKNILVIAFGILLRGTPKFRGPSKILVTRAAYPHTCLLYLRFKKHDALAGT